MGRLLIIFLLMAHWCQAQWSDSFADGNFTADPEWVGTVGNFVVSEAGMLQLQAPEQGGQSWLFTRSEVMAQARWSARVQMQFNPSSANYCRFYLAADSNDPALMARAIYIQMGTADDNVSLVVFDNGKATQWIKGAVGRLNIDLVQMVVTVERQENEWMLFTEIGGQKFLEGKAVVNPEFSSAWSGVWCGYTSTRSNKFWFDDFVATGAARPDREGPVVQRCRMRSALVLELVWNEPVTMLPDNLKWLNRQAEVVSIENKQTDTVLVAFSELPGEFDHEPLALSGVADVHRNLSSDTTLRLSYAPFRVEWVIMPSDRETQIRLNRPMDAARVEQVGFAANFSNSIPVSRSLMGDSLIQLHWNNPVAPRQLFELQISGLTDLEGNAAADGVFPMGYYPLGRNDLVIAECMIDPEPDNGMGEWEYVEIQSRLPVAVPLGPSTWQVNGVRTALPDWVCAPYGIFVLSPSKSAAFVQDRSRMFLSKWPALLNSHSNMVLQTAGCVLDAFRYGFEKYAQGSFKDEGGWSLERKDLNNFSHSAENWSHSLALSGGTPGLPNSVQREMPDAVSPRVVSVQAIDSAIIKLYFSEPMSFPKGALQGKWNGTTQEWSRWQADTVFSDRLEWWLNEPMAYRMVYAWESSTLTDCAGNALLNWPVVRVGLPMVPEAGDWAINEVLFNPVGDAPDFVEIYNKSDKVFGSESLRVGLIQGGTIPKLAQIHRGSELLFPGDYRVVTPDSALMPLFYRCNHPEWILQSPAFPSLNDQSACLVLTTAGGEVLEQFCYNEKMHHPLIRLPDGVSLERVDPFSSPDNPFNWTSALSVAGYSTPTDRNANFRTVDLPDGNTLVAEPEVFTPDADGNDDRVLIHYRWNETGWSGTIRVMDAYGRLVNTLARNDLFGLEGFLAWDGLSEEGRAMAPGVYLIQAECWNLNGRTARLKTHVVLGVKPEI